MNKIFISANDFQKDCFQLAQNIYKSNFNPDVVIGIWRGGSLPAIIIHEYLVYQGREVLSNVITTKSYTGIGEQSEKVEIDISEKVLNNLKEATNILLVDDVVDSGKTIESIFQCLEKKGVRGNIQVASVYYKPMISSITPDYYIHKTNQWIVFPHELEGLTQKETILKGIKLLKN
jgi:hypoxanthine phosphoribosyltransferase